VEGQKNYIRTEGRFTLLVKGASDVACEHGSMCWCSVKDRSFFA
jgi:hypothetical protein